MGLGQLFLNNGEQRTKRRQVDSRHQRSVSTKVMAVVAPLVTVLVTFVTAETARRRVHVRADHRDDRCALGPSSR